MIGNLILALGLACCCGAPLVSDNELQPKRAITTETTEFTAIDNGAYQKYASFNVVLGAQSTSTFYDYDVNSLSLTTGNANYGNMDASTLYSVANDLWGYDYEFMFVCSKYNDSARILRFFVPFNSSINGIQLHFTDDVKYGFMNYSSSNAVILPSVSNNVQVSALLYDNSYFYANTSTTTNYTGSEFPLKFSYYYFLLTDNTTSIGLSIDLLNLDGAQYNAGYNNGYSAGYNDGISVGYTNGYSQGLSTATGANANVKNLFGVLADTPIRFLKQMFNFELFGMNVAVVILSCLSAIVVFAIIKKVWK